MCKAHYELTDWLKHLSYFLDKSSKTEFSAIATQVFVLSFEKNHSIATHGKYLKTYCLVTDSAGKMSYKEAFIVSHFLVVNQMRFSGELKGMNA